VVEGGVDHAIRLGGAAPQAVEVSERGAANVCAHRGQGLRRFVRAGNAENLMAGGDQLLHDGRADPPRGTGDKYTHEQVSRLLATDIRSCSILVKK
jgi:hypothetical protein